MCRYRPRNATRVAPWIGDDMQGGDKRWEQHRPQDHYEYHDWKEHHITYFLPRTDRGICVFNGPGNAARFSPAKGRRSRGDYVIRSVLFSKGAGPTIGALALYPDIRRSRHRDIGDIDAFRSVITTA
jgi:hypothetical protein